MRIAAVGVLALALLAAGCGGSSNRYATYEDTKASIRKIDAVIASLPAYEGADVRTRQDHGVSYHIAPNDFIEAEPYSSILSVDVAKTVSAETLRHSFRSRLRARGWSCSPRRGRPRAAADPDSARGLTDQR